MSAERLRRFFVKEDDGYRVTKEIRETVVFAPQNVITDPPFTKLDLLSLPQSADLPDRRGAEEAAAPLPLQPQPRGHPASWGPRRPSAASPTSSPRSTSKRKLYRRRPSTAAASAVEFPAPTSQPSDGVRGPPGGCRARRGPASRTLADQLLLRTLRAGRACWSTSEGDLLYVHGRTGKYLEPAAGKANLNLFAMAREGLRHALWSAVQTAPRAAGARLAARGCG